jgi:hypothetical protein
MLPGSEAVYLWTHMHFQLEYNGDQIVVANVTEKMKEVQLPELADDSEEFEVTFSYSASWKENTEVGAHARARAHAHTHTHTHTFTHTHTHTHLSHTHAHTTTTTTILLRSHSANVTEWTTRSSPRPSRSTGCR